MNDDIYEKFRESCEFDEYIMLDNIKRTYNSIKILKDNIAEKRGKYRDFSNSVEIDYNILFECIDSYEKTLLIDCFTYSEQLVKKTIYTLLEVNTIENINLKNFFNGKIHPSKFSPNVKFAEIEKCVKEFYKDFKFIIKKEDNNKIRIYDELVKARHIYAHKGEYLFTFDLFEDVITVLEYITFELWLINNTEFNRSTVKNILKNFDKKIKKIENEIQNGICECRMRELYMIINSEHFDILLENILLKEEITKRIIRLNRICNH